MQSFQFFYHHLHRFPSTQTEKAKEVKYKKQNFLSKQRKERPVRRRKPKSQETKTKRHRQRLSRKKNTDTCNQQSPRKGKGK